MDFIWECMLLTTTTTTQTHTHTFAYERKRTLAEQLISMPNRFNIFECKFTLEFSHIYKMEANTSKHVKVYFFLYKTFRTA